MPNVNDLENIRKRAKRLVRDHADGVHTVADRIRRTLPRFAGLTDVEVLGTPFALHDAQHLIALELGFTDWTALKEAGMPDKPASSVTTPRAFAQVFVRDVARSLDWYRDVVGCDVDFAYGDPPFYASVSYQGATFNLRHTDASPWVAQPEDDDLLAVRLEIPDVKTLFLALRENGATFHQTLQTEPWGQETFIVVDPDGNLVMFGG